MDEKLWLHKGTGQWCRTFQGRRYYFGRVQSEAMARYLNEWPYIVRGLPVPDNSTLAGPAVGDLLNRWLEERLQDVHSGNIAQDTWDDYKRIAAFALDRLGRLTPVKALTPADFASLRRDFASAYTRSPTVLSRCVTVTRMAFRWGSNEGLFPVVPFGSQFVVASKAQKREAAHARGRQVFTPDEFWALHDGSQQPLTACLLLAMNGGYTQGELPHLRVEDYDGQVIGHLRNKTLSARTVPLWPLTRNAIEWHIGGRTSGPLLLNSYRRPLGRQAIMSAYSRRRKLVPVGVDGGFGKFRATFRTAADGCNDANAIRRIMGHEVGEGVEAAYIRNIETARLQAVVDHVAEWLGVDRE